MKLLPLLQYIPLTTLWITTGASLLAGVANVGIIALISRSLTVGNGFTSRFALQFALVVLVVVALDFGVKWLLLRLSAGTSYQLRSVLSLRILETPLEQLEKIGSPRLLAALTDDVQLLAAALNQIPNVTTALATLLGCIAYLTWLSPPTLLMAGLLTIPPAIGQVWVRKIARKKRAASLQCRNHLYKQYSSLTEGAKELRIHRARRLSFLHEQLLPAAHRYETFTRQAQSLHYLAASWTQFIFFFFILALFLLASAWELSSEILTSFALIALYARTSINGLLGILPFIADAAVAAQQLEEIGVHLTEKVSVSKGKSTSTDFPISLRTHRLFHSYQLENDDNAFHLGPVDLEFVSGELVFLIGSNGSGKTTLAKLLLGLYAPEGGWIEWNGRPVTEANIDDYRQLFSVVFADFFLFDQILGLDNRSDDAQARTYLEKLQLSHKVHLNNGTLSTLDLSTGQRQRLALLTAYLEDRPVYLFDEWAAGQDPHFKELFYRQMLPELRDRGKLVIVISHDDRYFSVADRVIKLADGRIEYDLPATQLSL